MNLFLFDFTKTKTGAKTAPRAPKLSYLDERAPQLSTRVNYGTPAAGVVGHIYRASKESYPQAPMVIGRFSIKQFESFSSLV